MSDVHLVGIVCSLRGASVNGAAARAAAALIGGGEMSRPHGRLTIGLHDVSGLALFNGDHEEGGPPDAVVELYDTVRAADGVVLFSPEYNSSLPAVTKNVIDWLSRDPSTWDGAGITMIVLSPGGRAGRSAREHFEAIMPRQKSRVFPTLGLGNSGPRLDGSGEVTDAATLTELRVFLADFAEFCVTSPA